MLSVSVIIPAYNALRWLPETLQSVAAQQYPNTEVIIVDDGSTDATGELIKTGWPEAIYVRTENKGVSHARNLGARMATGDLVQYLDADDLLLPGKITRQVALMVANEDIDVIYSNWQRLDAQPDGSFQPGEIVSRSIADVHEDPEVAFFTSMWCPTGAYLYRRSFLDTVGPWKEWLPVIQDARFALDCAMTGARWLHDPEISVLYRQHQKDSISTRNQLAFLQDCAANAGDVCRIWREKGKLKGARRNAVLAEYLSLGSSSFDLDRELFHCIHQALLQLDPHFTPKGWKRVLLSKLVGYPATEQIASWCRRLRKTAS